MSFFEGPEGSHDREVSWKSANPSISTGCSALRVVAED